MVVYFFATGNTKDLSDYDTIFIGYPLWWGEAPNIVWNFVESNDFSGKTLEGFAPDASWLDGQRFRSGVAATDVQSWVSGLELAKMDS